MAITREQIGELEAVLRERQRELNAGVNERLENTSSEGLQELAGMVGDSGDESVANMITDLNLTSTSRDVSELRHIEAALLRIADGTYGECVACGIEIEYERLKAYPTALRCLACQAQHEKVYAGQGTPSL